MLRLPRIEKKEGKLEKRGEWEKESKIYKNVFVDHFYDLISLISKILPCLFFFIRTQCSLLSYVRPMNVTVVLGCA